MTTNFIKIITRYGIQDCDCPQKNRSIIITNHISLLLMLGVLIIYIFRRFVYGSIPNGFNNQYLLIGLFFSALPVLMNRFNFTTISRFSLSVFPVLFIWYFYIDQLQVAVYVELTMYDSLRLFLLALSVVPFMIINNKEKGLLVFSIAPSFFSIIFLDRIIDFFHLGPSYFNIHSQDYELMAFRTNIAYLLLGSWSYIFHSMILHADMRNEDVQRLLQERNMQTEKQNTELSDNKRQLRELNWQLEEMLKYKTESVNFQAKKIRHLAYSNAHHLRAPLARLMGLIQLTKIDKETDLEFYLDKIEFEATDINGIIKSISVELNDAHLLKIENNEVFDEMPEKS